MVEIDIDWMRSVLDSVSEQYYCYQPEMHDSFLICSFDITTNGVLELENRLDAIGKKFTASITEEAFFLFIF